MSRKAIFFERICLYLWQYQINNAICLKLLQKVGKIHPQRLAATYRWLVAADA
jgi:hypothetical protein